MPNVGDMVAYLDADTQRFNAAMKQAQREAKMMGVELKNAVSGGGGGGMGAARAGGMATQAGFMLQDFSSVMQNGGGLGRAIGAITNNVQMLGMAFGPVGASITAVGGALAGIIIPALLDAAGNAKEYADRLKEMAEASDRVVQAGQRQVQQQQQMRRLMEAENGAGLQAERKAADDRIELIQREIKDREDALRAQQQVMQEGGLGGVRREVGGIRRLDANGSPIEFGKQQRQEVFDVGNDAMRGDLLKREQAIKELRDRERELIDQRKQLFGGEREMRAMNAEAEGRRRQHEQEMKAFAERVQAIERMNEATKTPQEKYADEVNRIQEMLRNGDISGEMAGRALYGARQQLPQVKMTQEAAVYGSSAALSAITKAQVDSQRVQEQKSLERQLLDKAIDQVRLLEQIADQKTVELSPVVIPP